MTFETALYNYLSTYAGLSALVSNRIYPPEGAPQNPTKPYVVYQQISGPEIHAMGTDPGIIEARLQFSCWATSNSGAKAVAKQIRLAFRNYSGTMGGAGGVTVYHAQVDNAIDDEYNYETDLCRVMVDVLITHGE